jgi:hypothetical protein
MALFGDHPWSSFCGIPPWRSEVPVRATLICLIGIAEDSPEMFFFGRQVKSVAGPEDTCQQQHHSGPTKKPEPHQHESPTD